MSTLQIVSHHLASRRKKPSLSVKFSLNCQSKYTASLHVTHDADGNRASGYYGAGISGCNSKVLEEMCASLGEFAETIARGFGITSGEVIKFMVYTASEAVFPLHRDFVLQHHVFRVSISLSEFMPDFAMSYENTKSVFEIARGFLAVVIMDVRAAGRMAINRGRGVIKHGTLRTATADALAVFFVFGVFASAWLA
jgi:hypothetical protein